MAWYGKVIMNSQIYGFLLSFILLLFLLSSIFHASFLFFISANEYNLKHSLLLRLDEEFFTVAHQWLPLSLIHSE